MTISTRPLSHALGAEVLGVDLAAPFDDATRDRVWRLFLDHGILLFRDQRLSTAQHVAASRRFGELDAHDATPKDRHPDFPEVLLITTRPKPNGAPSDTRYTGRVWHSDHSFTLVPATGSLLRSVAVPEVGGDTMFTNMSLAYEALSPGMQRMLARLEGVHTSSRKIDDPQRAAEMQRMNPPVAQPVVRVHPETGRKALYIGEKVRYFAGMTVEESRPLIRYLCRHATRPEFVYRHHWRVGDLLMWDNRSTMHVALGDFDQTQLRHMERTTLRGTPSGHVYAGPLH